METRCNRGNKGFLGVKGGNNWGAKFVCLPPTIQMSVKFYDLGELYFF